jgi:hypothetical protein
VVDDLDHVAIGRDRGDVHGDVACGELPLRHGEGIVVDELATGSGAEHSVEGCPPPAGDGARRWSAIPLGCDSCENPLELACFDLNQRRGPPEQPAGGALPLRGARR